ncbi:High-affinity glucose transporter [Smittium culicis]|uniref:High-affinity glucose transporter n=1 Tax=Smittium culicis TaxID=133412 RepID=A0A1R1XE64_9FUNG|nr:High-affinity glucose transporter [Smittium culicis]
MVSYTSSYIVAAIASIGGMLLGYDIGAMSNIISMKHFKEYFGNPPMSKISVVVAILAVGCFVGSLISGQLCDRISRKRTIMLGSLIFTFGSILQGMSTSMTVLVLGRIMNGIAIGFLSQAVPTYQSEMSAPEIRGRMVSLQQFSITVGILVSFWIGIGCSRINSNVSWRLPLFFQVAFSVLLFVSMIFMPFSPRWLVANSRENEALSVLARLRSGGDESDSYVLEELDSIKNQVKTERSLSVQSYKELFVFPTKRRLYLGIIVQCFQQLTGINVIMYYAPIIFEQAGLGGSSASLIAHGINGFVNVIFTIPAILYVDRWGRRSTLVMGAIVCSVSYFVLAICMTFGSQQSIGLNGEKIVKMGPGLASYTSIAMVYVFVAAFAISWGPVAWIYPSEIFSMSTRAKATSLTTAANWVSNFSTNLVAPILMSLISFYLYYIFAILMVIAAITVYFFFPETNGRTLEEMDIVFGGTIWAYKDEDRVNREIIERGLNMADK